MIPALLALLILAPLAWAGYALLGNGQEPATPAPRIAVPNLVGTTLDEARDDVGEDFKLVEAGQADGTEPAGTILEQDPQEGGELRRGSEISVTVASGQNDVPDTTGDPRAEAERTLEEAGFETRVVRAESPPEDEGLVTGQEPAGGALGAAANLGTRVEITLGTGPDDVAIPGLVGNTTAQAEDILAQSDLELGSVGQDYSDTVPEGSVISQDPPEGASLAPGSRVNVTESLGVGQVEVPEVYGFSLEEAQARLSGVGINSDPIEVPGDEAAGTALSTEPGVGALVDPGSTLPLYFSAGPEPTVVSPEPDASPPPDEEEPDKEEPDEPDESAPPDASAPPANGQVGGGDAAREEDNSGPNRGSGRGNAGNVPPNVQENVQNNENVPGAGRGNGGGRGGRGGGDRDD